MSVAKNVLLNVTSWLSNQEQWQRIKNMSSRKQTANAANKLSMSFKMSWSGVSLAIQNPMPSSLDCWRNKITSPDSHQKHKSKHHQALSIQGHQWTILGMLDYPRFEKKKKRKRSKHDVGISTLLVPTPNTGKLKQKRNKRSEPEGK